MHGKPSDNELSRDEPSDGELARRIAGSTAAPRDAIAELYRRFWPRVRSFGLRHLRDDEAARDLAQHVVLLAVDKLRSGEVQDPERIASFILSTARWSLHSQRRDDRRLQYVEHDHLSRDLGDGAIGVMVPAAAEALVNREWIRGCLESLAERERTVVVLSFFQGCTAREIADTTGLTPGNVRVVRHRALGLLRHCLGGQRESDSQEQVVRHLQEEEQEHSQ